ncbi:MAG: ABC transporter permease [Asgard group archaeon]|nr:ABC transporter permease [Asgard group archaeon]
MEKTPKEKIKNAFFHFGNSLRRIGNQLKISIKLFFRSPFTTSMLFLYPIILLLLFGSIFAKTDTYKFTLYVQDRDNSPTSINLYQNLADEELLDVFIIEDITINPRNYLREIDTFAFRYNHPGPPSCLVIPENWEEDSLLPGISNITLIIDPFSYTSDRIIEIVTRNINELNLNISEPKIHLEKVSFVSDAVSYIDFFLPGIIGVIIINTGILGTINRQVRFKYTGIFKKYATTPLTRWEHIVSELIWQFLIAFVTSTLAIFTAWVAFGFSWVSFNALLLVVVFVGVVLFSGIGLLVSQLVKNPTNTYIIGFLITIPLMFLSGVFFDISGIRALFVISKFSPLTFIVDAARASMITNNIGFAWINIGIAFLIGLVAIIVGALITKWEKD